MFSYLIIKYVNGVTNLFITKNDLKNVLKKYNTETTSIFNLKIDNLNHDLNKTITLDGQIYNSTNNNITLPNYPTALPANGGNADTVKNRDICAEIDNLKTLSVNGKEMLANAINGVAGTSLNSSSSYDDMKAIIDNLSSNNIFYLYKDGVTDYEWITVVGSSSYSKISFGNTYIDVSITGGSDAYYDYITLKGFTVNVTPYQVFYDKIQSGGGGNLYNHEIFCGTESQLINIGNTTNKTLLMDVTNMTGYNNVKIGFNSKNSGLTAKIYEIGFLSL